MAEMTRDDLDRMAQRIEAHADGHFVRLEEQLREIDDRVRATEVTLGRHDQRLDNVETENREQWTILGRIRNGRREDQATAGKPAWRSRARAGGGLALLVAGAEALHQLGLLIVKLLAMLMVAKP